MSVLKRFLPVYAATGVFYVGTTPIQYIYGPNINDWIGKFPLLAQPFVFVGCCIVGGALWPITLTAMTYRDMTEEKRIKQKI